MDPASCSNMAMWHLEALFALFSQKIPIRPDFAVSSSKVRQGHRHETRAHFLVLFFCGGSLLYY